MNEFEMIVMVVLILSIAAIVITAINVRSRRREERSDPRLADENRRLGAEVTTLKERVAVLERIATDKNHRLEHEIEQLRSH